MRLTSEQAAHRLGVKRETLYAYVSRGLLSSERDGGGRATTFSADEVNALAERTRRGGRAGGLEVVVASGISLIEGDRLYYRGLDAVELARDTPFEVVAEWLWSGDVSVFDVSVFDVSVFDVSVFDPRPDWPGPSPPPAISEGVDAINRLRAAVADVAAADDLRYDLEPRAVAMAGRRMLASMVEALPVRGPIPARAGPYPMAARLWPRLGPARATARLVHALNAALVLLADHELAASTLAARVAASVRADPYSVVSTGLGVMGGSLHGAASHLVVDLFEEVGSPAAASRVVGERLRAGGRLPGLGHKVYRQSDPRAVLVLELLAALPLPRDRWRVVEAVQGIVGARLPLVVNVDFAIGALVYSTGMERNAGDAIFSIARAAGWLAHALEEYAEPPARFRPRAAYTGPRPQA